MDTFEDIRPFSDEEMRSAMKRIVESEYFPLMADFIFPSMPVPEVKERVLAYRTVYEFQHDTMFQLNRQIVLRSTDGLVYEGLENLEPQKPYLFVSNHRDIMLDSCLLQYILFFGGRDTTQITFGANLMTNPLVVDIGRSNKMFKVERPGGSIREFYNSSKRLSSYIRMVLTQKKESLWIAQRNGRTKDGIDATDQGIIKMFGMSADAGADRVSALAELNIAPVAVSYEWEPCDGPKAAELLISRSRKYEKAPDEDLKSILSGLLMPKGRVTFRVCKPLTYEEIAACSAANVSDGDFHKAVAALIDSRILAAYKLYPNNFIARDLLEGITSAGLYEEAQKEAFIKHKDRVLAVYDLCPREELEKIFLEIYANPVKTVTGCLKDRIRSIIGEAVPLADLDSSFFFSELDSLGIMSVLLALSGEFKIELGAADATPRNLMNIDSIAAMVVKKMAGK